MLTENDWFRWVNKAELFFFWDIQRYITGTRIQLCEYPLCFFFFALLWSFSEFPPALFFALLPMFRNACLLSFSHNLSHFPICDCSFSSENHGPQSPECESWFCLLLSDLSSHFSTSLASFSSWIKQDDALDLWFFLDRGDFNPFPSPYI